MKILPLDQAALRRAAEQRLATSPPQATDVTDIRRLLHELQVRQIELELQNEELRRTWLEVDAARSRYRELYDFAPVAYVSLEDGDVIGEINGAGAVQLGVPHERLTGRRLGSFIAPASQAAFQAMLGQALSTHAIARCEIALRVSGRQPCLMRAEALYDVAGTICRVVMVDITLQKAIEEERLAHEKQIADMARHLVTAQETERRRLSAQLFDRASPNLAAIRLNLGSLRTALTATMTPLAVLLLDDIDALLGDTLTSVRETCADLRPTVLDYAGLLPALESYARQLADRTGIAIRVSGSGSQAPERLDVELESLMFRIAQEALMNCANHAMAQHIDVSLAVSGRRAVMSISDDGIGFDPAAPTTHDRIGGHGLAIMRERAAFASGRLQVESRPRHGTRITFDIG